MAITNKTRKILWGKSGNRCAICKQELVVDATATDDESVIGEECHVISPNPYGPRYDPSYPKKKIDDYENLILLCRTHHKMVDDQDASFTVDILRQMKTNHEVWVSQKLTDVPIPKPLKFRRVKQNIPKHLIRLTTGRALLNLLMDTYALSTRHDELKTQEEVELVGFFLQTIKDLADLGEDLEPKDQVSSAFELTKSLEELEEAGFFVFSGREVQLLEGGVAEEPSNFPIAIIAVLRKESDEILHLNLAKSQKDNNK